LISHERVRACDSAPTAIVNDDVVLLFWFVWYSWILF